MKLLHLFILVSIFLVYPLQSFAFKDECRKVVNVQKYLYKGDFDKKSPSEKIYNFESIRNDLKDELVSKEKVDPKKVNCLNDLYDKGISDAATYWSDRGREEGCLSKGQIPKTRPEECNEKTWKEFRKSRKYLTSLEEEKKKMLRPLAEANDKKADDCPPVAVATPKSFDEIAKVADATRTNMCCGSPQDKLGVVKAVYPEISHEQCLAKISNSNDEMLSIKGLAMCSANIVATAIKTIWDSLKSAVNFFTSPSQMIGAMSALKELATNEQAREQFTKKLKESVNQFISTRNSSFNNCLNSYEKSMYICEVTGSVIGSMVDIGVVLKVVKALRYGTAGAEIANLLNKTQKGQKVLSAMKKAEDFTTSTVGKAKNAVKESAEKVAKSVAKDARAFALAASLLKTDVGFDEQLLKQMKKAENNAETRVSTVVNETPKLSGTAPAKVPDAAPSSSPSPSATPEMKAFENDVRATVLSTHLQTADVNFDQQLAKQLKHAEDNAITRLGTNREPVAAPVAMKIDSPAPAPLRLQHNGQDIDINASLNAQRRADATAAADNKPVVNEVVDAPRVEAPAPLRLQHNGQDIDLNASLNAQRRTDAAAAVNNKPIGSEVIDAPRTEAPAPLRLQHNRQDIDLNASLNAQRRADAAVPVVNKPTVPDVVDAPATQRKSTSAVDAPSEPTLPTPSLTISAVTRAQIRQAPQAVTKPSEPLRLTYNSKAPDAPSAPKVEAPPSIPEAQPVRKPKGDLSASNSIRSVNQRDGLEPRMNEKQRLNQANDLKVTDVNRAHEVEFRVTKSQKEIDSVLGKLFPDGSGPEAQALRRMLGFSPANGYVTPAEFDAALKFVKEIEKKGGQDYLKTLNLTNDEIDTLNYLTARVPHYAQYADGSAPHNLSSLPKKAPTDATPVATPAAPAPKPQARVPSAAEEAAAAKANQIRDHATQNLASLNSRNKGPNPKHRETLAKEFGLNDNTAAAIDWNPVGTRADVQSIFKKAFPADTMINVQNLRKMTAFNPRNGYLNGTEIQTAKRFVEAIEKEGGIEKLNLGALTKSEKETFNELIKRVPEYLRYNDPSFTTNIKPIIID